MSTGGSWGLQLPIPLVEDSRQRAIIRSVKEKFHPFLLKEISKGFLLSTVLYCDSVNVDWWIAITRQSFKHTYHAQYLNPR